MKRIAIVLAAVIVLCGAAYAASLAVEWDGWARSIWYDAKGRPDPSGHSLRVEGVLRNDSKKHYEYVQIKYGIYAVKTQARVKVQSASITDLLPGDRWQFMCEPMVFISLSEKAKDRYYFKLIKIKSREAT